MFHFRFFFSSTPFNLIRIQPKCSNMALLLVCNKKAEYWTFPLSPSYTPLATPIFFFKKKTSIDGWMSTQLAAAPSSGFRIDQQPVTNAEKIDNFQTHTKRVFCDLISVEQYFRTFKRPFRASSSETFGKCLHDLPNNSGDFTLIHFPVKYLFHTKGKKKNKFERPWHFHRNY